MILPNWKRSVPLPSAVRLAWHESEPFPREVPLNDLYGSLAFPPTGGPLPYLVCNMVMTQNGEATVGGKASTIGTSVDGVVLTRVRAAVDAVVTGSGTLLADDVTAVLPEREARRRVEAGRPARLLAVVLATTLDWGPDVLSRKFFSRPGFDKLVVTGDRARAQDVERLRGLGVDVARVQSGPDGRPDPAAALGLLAARGVRAAVCEGGPHLLPSFFRAALVGEYFLTTSPMVTGEPGVPRPLQGDVTMGRGVVLLSRVSRYEHEFQNPGTGARLVEAFDRFRVIYPVP